jgi:hypothetical protein
VPMLDPEARRQGLKAHLLPWEQLSLRQGPEALPEPVAPRQAWRHPRQPPCRWLLGARQESTCRGSTSFAYSVMPMVQRMAELVGAQKFLVPQVT